MIVCVVLRKEACNGGCVTVHRVFDELLDVDGVEERLTHAVVVEGLLDGVEHEERQAEALDVVHGGSGGGQLVGVGVGHVLHDLDGAFRKMRGARGVVKQYVPMHVVGGRRLRAVVVGVGLEFDCAAVVAVDALVHPRAGARWGSS